MKGFKHLLLAMLIVLAYGLPAQAQTQTPTFPDAIASDPKTLGWMQEFPPTPDKTIRFDNGSFYRFPAFRWSCSNMRELVPTKNVWRGDGPAVLLPRAERNLDDVPFTDMTGKPMTWLNPWCAIIPTAFWSCTRGKWFVKNTSALLSPRSRILLFQLQSRLWAHWQPCWLQKASSIRRPL